jgi:hypothetical protein
MSIPALVKSPHAGLIFFGLAGTQKNGYTVAFFLERFPPKKAKRPHIDIGSELLNRLVKKKVAPHMGVLQFWGYFFKQTMDFNTKLSIVIVY